MDFTFPRRNATNRSEISVLAIMRRKHRIDKVVLLCFGLFYFGPASSPSMGQNAGLSSVYATPKPEASMEKLVDLIHNLQGQVQELNLQLKAVRSEQQSEREQNAELLSELETLKRQLATVSQVAEPSGSGVTPPSARGGASNSKQEAPLEDRVARIEETQQLTDSKLQDLNQTRVESGSKYRLRLSGIVLLNLFSTRGAVDNQDIPQIAIPRGLTGGAGTFGGTLRQSQIGLDGFGPEIWGAKTSANVKFDFAGGFPNTPNGMTLGIARLRTGVVRFDWESTSLIAGQDSLFLSPMSPTSLASLAVPALAYSGNLWSWAPQLRVEHQFHVSDLSKLLLQGAIMDNLSGDVPKPPSVTNPTINPTAGENSGQPAYAMRVAWTNPLWGEPMTIGVGGYYSRQNWGFSRRVDGWAGTADLSMPMGPVVEFDAEFYRGRALGGLGGGIGQSVLWHGPLLNPATNVYGLDSIGGWAQLRFKLNPRLELNGAFGQDNPYAGELRSLGGNTGFYNSILSRNMTPLANVIYQPRSNIAVSLEYRYLKTYPLDRFPNSANHVNLSVGYIF